MSKSYLKEYKADQDRYIETTKLDTYKRWSQRPELNPPDEDLTARIAFVSEYTARPEFVSEQRRRTAYGLLTDFFNVAMVIFLVVHFGRQPIKELIKDMIEGVSATMDRARGQHEEAAQHKADAQAKIDGLSAQKSEQDKLTDLRIEEMRREDANTVAQRLSNLNRETEDRRQHEETLARLELKRELVDQALDLAAERFRTQTDPEEHSALIDQFVQQMEEGR
jgi:F-type H+-transporting ATPase subunit b